ncbi:MAG: hypothetical protein M3325_07585 [Actinomycetota bacterium]|nr:hypothetical protein [Actinomycetota bacterium]
MDAVVMQSAVRIRDAKRATDKPPQWLRRSVRHPSGLAVDFVGAGGERALISVTVSITSLSASQVLELAKSRAAAGKQFRPRTLDGGPYRVMRELMR